MQDCLQNEKNLACTNRACAGHRLWRSGSDVQALTFWGVLEELDLGKRVPDLQGLGYSMLGVNDSLTFTSNTWNITFDPYSGAAGSPTPSRGPPIMQVIAAGFQHMAPVVLFASFASAS